jgi:hypothetical protein
VRRLTIDGLDGWITPEFAWNPALAADPTGPQELLWTELRLPDDLRIDRPSDPLGELAEASGLLAHPPQPNPSAGAWARSTRAGRG